MAGTPRDDLIDLPAVAEVTLQQHEVEPASELETDAGHSGYFDESQALMEADGTLVVTVDGGDHDPFSRGRSPGHELDHEGSSHTGAMVRTIDVDRMFDGEAVALPLLGVSEVVIRRKSDDRLRRVSVGGHEDGIADCSLGSHPGQAMVDELELLRPGHRGRQHGRVVELADGGGVVQRGVPDPHSADDRTGDEARQRFS